MRAKTLYSSVAGLTLLFGAACNDLDVVNPNNPDIARALASAEDVEALANSTVNSWYLTSTYFEPYMMLQVTSDASTSNFGNFGMRFNNLEPRIAYENNSAGGDREVTRFPWDNNYAVLGAANDVLRALDGGLVIRTPTETEKARHLAMLTQALSLSNLALMFDQAFIVDQATDPIAAPPQLVPYTDVAAAASERWDALIAAAANKSHAYSAQVLPSTPNFTSTVLWRFANTMHALTLGYMPRSADEVASVNWAKVAALTANGIGTGSAGAPFDLLVQGDFNSWYSLINYYGNENSWVRVDHRLINRMDPSYPAKFNGTIVPAGTSPDARHGTDYRFLNNVIGDPGRGIYMQSAWYHARYQHHARLSPTGARTNVPYVLAAESDLMRAEALIRSGGSLGEAADLINKTRVGRGQLPAAAAGEGADALLAYIDYERDIELLNTNGFQLFQRRHVTPRACTRTTHQLQVGTVRHLPIPAKELETLALPIYTFGGACDKEE
jgi:starch-binding outer membrane protein, SusD/RagB family